LSNARSRLALKPLTTTDSTGADASWAQTGQLDKLASKAISETVDLELPNMKFPLDQTVFIGRKTARRPP